MNKYDRHGRNISDSDPDVREATLAIRLESVVDPIARIAFRWRNGQRAGWKLSPELRGQVRRDLREALRHACRARDALLAGNEPRFELEHANAEIFLQMARARVLQADAKRVQLARAAGKRGGRKRQDEQAAEWVRRYDRMRATRRTLTARECYEDIAADDLGDPARWRTVANRISEYRSRQK